MAYLQEIIRPGETVRHVGRLHWIIYARGVAFVLMFGLLYATLPSISDDLPPLTYYAVGIGELLSLLLLLNALARQISTEIVITDRRAILKSGFVARRTIEMNMDKIESVDVSQGVLGRMLGFGDVVLRGTGSGIEPLRVVIDPIGLRNAITVV